MPIKQSGMSLIELLVTMTIVAIVLIFLLPNHHFLILRSNETLFRSQLLNIIKMARQEAILRGVTMTLCHSHDGKTCEGSWKEGALLFRADPDGNETIYFFSSPLKEGAVHWRAFPRNRDYLQMASSGLMQNENGTFWYCAVNEKTPRWAIVLNKAGRARVVYPGATGEVLSEAGALQCDG